MKAINRKHIFIGVFTMFFFIAVICTGVNLFSSEVRYTYGLSFETSKSEFEMVNQAGLRVDGNGLSFKVKIAEEHYNYLIDGDTINQLHFALIPESNISTIIDAVKNGEFDTIAYSTTNNCYSDILVPISNIYEENGSYFAKAGMDNISKENAETNYVAWAYLCKSVINGDSTVYSNYEFANFYDDNYVRSTSCLYTELKQNVLTIDSPAALFTSYTWFGTDDYPLYICNAAEYSALVIQLNDSEISDCFVDKKILVEDFDLSGVTQTIPESFSENVTAVHKISFVQDSEDEVVIKVKHGESIENAPVLKTVKGYNVAWNASDLTNITSSFTVAVEKTPKTYTVHYDANGGTVSSATTEVTYDAAYTLLVPTKEYADFNGWKSGENTLDNEGIWQFDSDIYLVAEWIEKEVKLTLSRYSLGLTLDAEYRLAKLDKEFYVNENGTYNSTTLPKGFVWSSSDTDVVTVKDGVVKAMGTGSATVKLSNEKCFAECAVTVYDKAISTAAEFEAIGANLTGRYLLVNDIDLGNKNYSGWSVISSGDSNFTGIIDGNGYSVKNITFSASMRGIFVNMSGTLKNISFENVTVEKGDSNRGGIIAHTSTGGLFENIYIQAVVTRSVPGFGGYVAPIVYDPKVLDGTIPTTVKNCMVNLSGSTADVCGQFIGNAGAANCAVLEDCYAIDANADWLAGSLQRVTGWDTCVRSNDIEELYTLSENFKNLDPEIWNIDAESMSIPSLKNYDALFIDLSKNEVRVGGTAQITLNLVLNGDVASINVTNAALKSSNPEIATISEQGVVSALSSGVTIITVSYEANGTILEGICEFIVKPDADIVIDRTSINLANIDGYKSVKLSGKYYEANELQTMPENAVWTSSDNNVAIVSQEGIVTAVGSGKAVISFSADDVIGTCEVIVYDYAINSVADFQAIGTNPSSTYMLISDIDFSEMEISGLSVISSTDVTFSGLLDGNGYAVKNIKFTSTMRGIFTKVIGTIRNIAFENINVCAGEAQRGGVLASHTENATFENIYVKAVVTRAKPSFGGAVGALVWTAQGGSVYKNCVIDLTGSTKGNAGQFCGTVSKADTLTNCYALDDEEDWICDYKSRLNGLDTCVRANSVEALYDGSNAFEGLDANVWKIDSEKQEVPHLIANNYWIG